MKKIENGSSVMMIIENYFKKDYPGFEFEPKAVLVKIEHIKEGPVWLLKAHQGNRTIVFLWETATKYGYALPFVPDHEDVVVKPVPSIVKDKNGKEGKVVYRDNEISIIWDE